MLQRSLDITKMIPQESTAHILELFAFVHSELNEFKKAQSYTKLLLEDSFKKYEAPFYFDNY